MFILYFINKIHSTSRLADSTKCSCVGEFKTCLYAQIRWLCCVRVNFAMMMKTASTSNKFLDYIIGTYL